MFQNAESINSSKLAQNTNTNNSTQNPNSKYIFRRTKTAITNKPADKLSQILQNKLK